MSTLTWIDSDTVNGLINRSDLFNLLEDGLSRYSRGFESGIEQPQRHMINISQYNGFLGVMPCYSKFDDILATKLVTFYPGKERVATHHAWIMHMDPANGSLLAVIDGHVITGERTGLVSAIATKYLADKNSKILAILGSGVQARSHYQALLLLFQFDEVRIWSRTKRNAEKLAQEINNQSGSGITLATPHDTVEEAVKNADVICVATFATEPILKAEWVKAGAHINAVGAVNPCWRELDNELMRTSLVYCETKEGCLIESGDIILSKCEIYGEIGEIISGKVEAFRDKTTVFKSVGMAIEDGICSKYIYEKFIENQKEKTENN